MFLDALTNLGTELVIKGFSALTVVAAAATSLVAIAIPTIADFSLVIAAVFAPFCLAIYPLSKSWANACLNTAVHAVMVGVGTAIFLQILLGQNGILKGAIDATTASMKVSGENFMPVVGGLLGLCVVYALSCIVLLAIPGIVQSIFGGFSLNAGVPVAGAVMAGMGAGGKMSAAAAVVGGKGAMMGVAMAAKGMGQAMGGGESRSSQRSASAVMNSIGAGPAAQGGSGASGASGTTRASNPAAASGSKSGQNSYRPAAQTRGTQPVAQPPKSPSQVIR